MLLKEIIKSGVIITLLTAISVIVGFVSLFAESRVLGLPFESTEAAVYLLQTGKMILQTLQSLQTILNGDKLWASYVLSYRWWLIVCGICVALKFGWGGIMNIMPNWLWQKLQYRSPLIIFRGLGVGIVCLGIGSIMTDYYRVRNVLQYNTVLGWEMYEYAMPNFQNAHNPDCRETYNTEVVSEYYKRYLKIFPESLFNPLNENNQQQRKASYQAVVVLLVTLCVVVLLLSRTKWLRFAVFAFACVALAYVHGVLGTSYIYPVVTVYYTHGGTTVRQYNGLLLLRDGMEYQFFIDRADFMKIYRIPKKAIIAIEQKSKIDLFQNCAQREGEVVLCESSFW